MKLTSYSFITLSLIFSTTQNMETPPTQAKTQQESAGWTSWLPYGSQADTAAKGLFKAGEGFKDIAGAMTESSKIFKEAVENGVDILSENVTKASGDMVKATGEASQSMDKMMGKMDEIKSEGIKISLNNYSIKTLVTASIGGALALSGIILLIHTLMQKAEEKEDADQSWYLKLLKNRYLISALLMASGITLVLKSDTLVTKTA